MISFQLLLWRSWLVLLAAPENVAQHKEHRPSRTFLDHRDINISTTHTLAFASVRHMIGFFPKRTPEPAAFGILILKHEAVE